MSSTQAAPPHGAPPKRLIRNYLLDPRFQLKYTAIIVVVAVVLQVALGFVIMRTANTAAGQAQAAAGQAERAMAESQTSSRIMRMNQLMGAADNPDLVHTIEAQLAADDRRASHNLDEVRAQRGRIEEARRVTLYSLFAVGLALVVLLGVVGVVITHKVVGPVFKLKRLLRQVGTGRLNIKERLRKGDELEDLFETFLAMVDSLKATQEREMAQLAAAIVAVEHSEESEALTKLRALQVEMRGALKSPDSTIPPPA